MPDFTASEKYLYFRYLGPTLSINLTNFPWLTNVLKLTTFTPGSTNAQTSTLGAANGQTVGGTLKTLVTNDSYQLTGATVGWTLPNGIKINTLGFVPANVILADEDGYTPLGNTRPISKAVLIAQLRPGPDGLDALIAAAIANSGGGTGLFTPDAPTTPVTNDTANTFGWTDVGGKGFADAEYSINSGTAWQPATANPQPVGNINAAAGAMQVRYKAVDGSSNPSKTLVSTAAFTATSAVGGAVAPLVFVEGNTVVRDSATNTYTTTSTTGGPGQTVAGTGKKLPAGADGGLVLAGTSLKGFLGFVTSDAPSFFGNIKAGLGHAGTVYYIDNGTRIEAGGAMITANDYRLRRLAGAWSLSTAPAGTDPVTGTWTTIAATFTYADSVDLYPDIDLSGDPTAKIVNPRGFGLV